MTIKGSGCHAAQPHLGNDPILTAAHLISYYQSIITKFRNPLEPAVLSITSIDGRSVVNAIPDKVEMKGVIRTFNDEVKKDIVRAIEEKSPHICALYGCTFELKTIWGYPAVINNVQTTNKARDIAIQAVGKENVLPFEPKMWAEDFAQYQQTVPGTFVFLGVKPKGQKTMPPLHNAKLLPDTDALKTGVEFLARIGLNEK
jgi:amidohydrolase